MQSDKTLRQRHGHRRVPLWPQSSTGELLCLIHSAPNELGPNGGSTEAVPRPDAVARVGQRSRAGCDRDDLADVQATLDAIQAKADVAGRVIAQLVDVMRASFAWSYEPAARQLVSLNELVVDAIGALGERARAGGGVSVALDPKPPSVVGDTRQLRSVLHTLLVALMQEREASGDVSPITLRTSRAAGVLQGEHIARLALAGAARRAPRAWTPTCLELWPEPARARELLHASRVVSEHGGVLTATSGAASLRFMLELPSL